MSDGLHARPGAAEVLVLGFGVEAGETLDALATAIGGPVAAVARAGETPMRVSLRIPERALEELADPGHRADFAARLTDSNLALVGLDGTAPRSLRAPATKEQALLPDWRDEDRLHYTTALAGLLADLAPEGARLTLTTSPGAYGPLVGGTGAESDIADGLLRAAAALSDLARQTGRQVALGLLPTPFGLIDGAGSAIEFFRERLFTAGAERRFRALADLARNEGEQALRTHLGLAYDTAHAAVSWEDVGGALEAIADAEIPVHRLRLSAAAELTPITAEGRAALAALGPAPHLRPVIGTDAAGSTLRMPDLVPDALSDGALCRVLVRWPLTGRTSGPVRATLPAVRAAISARAAFDVPPQLEIVMTPEALGPDTSLPETMRAAGADLAWVAARL
ncbi:MAG: hypothetical protein ACFBRM_01635 [Pikeienuella sp.]